MSAAKARPYRGKKISPFISDISNQRQPGSILLIQMQRNNGILSPSPLLFLSVLCGDLEGQRNPAAGH